MIEIDDYWELLALHKAIMEVKFGKVENREFLTSPFLASVAKKVLIALVEADRKKNGSDKASGWDSWKIVDESRSEWVKLLKFIDENERYKTLSNDDVAREIRDVLSPLEISDDTVFELIEARIRKA